MVGLPNHLRLGEDILRQAQDEGALWLELLCNRPAFSLPDIALWLRCVVELRKSFSNRQYSSFPRKRESSARTPAFML